MCSRTNRESRERSGTKGNAQDVADDQRSVGRQVERARQFACFRQQPFRRSYLLYVACVRRADGPDLRAIVRETLVGGAPITHAESVNGGASRATPYTRRYRASRPHRSWGKTALIIGGGAGTGAGIGGIIHGKRGVLTGADFGCGVASLYEGAHRR